MENLSKAMATTIVITYAFYFIPYLISLGWGQGRNKSKKVCDLCFRDIKLINDKLKKINNQDNG